MTLLHAHLIKSGAGVTKSQVKGFLVFTNDEIIIDDEVKDHNSILIGPKVTKYISSLQKTWSQYILDPFKPSILTGALRIVFKTYSEYGICHKLRFIRVIPVFE